MNIPETSDNPTPPNLNQTPLGGRPAPPCCASSLLGSYAPNQVVKTTQKLGVCLIPFFVVSFLGLLRCGSICALVIWMPLWGGEFDATKVNDLPANPPPSELSVVFDSGHPPMPQGLNRLERIAPIDVGRLGGSQCSSVSSPPLSGISMSDQPRADENRSNRSEVSKYSYHQLLLKIRELPHWVYGLVGSMLGGLTGGFLISLRDRSFLHNVIGEASRGGAQIDQTASSASPPPTCCASLIFCEGEENMEQFNRLSDGRQEAVAVSGLHQEGQQHPPVNEL